jgi:hypothetical protein
MMAESEQVGTSIVAETSGTNDAPPPATPTPSQTPLPEWVSKLEGFDEQAKSKLSRYKTVNDIAKSALEFDKRISQSVVIPGKDATKETWDAYYKRLGRPESKDGYELDEIFLPDGVTKDSDEGFKEIAYELGLNKEQAAKLHKYAAQKGLDSYSNMKKQFEEKKEASRVALRKEWGGDYDRNISMIGNLLRKFGDEEIIKYMNNGPGNDTPMVKFLAKAGKAFSADTLERGSIPESVEDEEGSRLFPNSPQMTGANRIRRIR